MHFRGAYRIKEKDEKEKLLLIMSDGNGAKGVLISVHGDHCHMEEVDPKYYEHVHHLASVPIDVINGAHGFLASKKMIESDMEVLRRLFL